MVRIKQNIFPVICRFGQKISNQTFQMVVLDQVETQGVLGQVETQGVLGQVEKQGLTSVWTFKLIIFLLRKKRIFSQWRISIVLPWLTRAVFHG
jgi:hypothetical protein